MEERVLVVLTGKSRERLLKEGGTAHWSVTPSIVRGFKYVICVRHAHPPYDPGIGERPEPHGAAFLVARIGGLEVTKAERGKKRYRVLFSDVADIEPVEGFWGPWRNPVRYMDYSDVLHRGLDPKSLTFKPFAGRKDGIKVDADEPRDAVAPITIAEAKAGLAAHLRIRPDQIEILIKA